MSPRHPFRLCAALVLATLAPSAWAITYADWVASYGLTGDNAAATADPDNDGVPNLMEYGLAGRSPNAYDPPGTATYSSIATYDAPTITNPPTQSEVQALANAVQALSRRVKAIDDSLREHGLISA